MFDLRQILQIQNQFEQAHQVRVQQGAAVSLSHLQETVFPENPPEKTFTVVGASEKTRRNAARWRQIAVRKNDRFFKQF